MAAAPGLAVSRLVEDWVWATLTIWQEARGQGRNGKIAVAEVIRNRTRLRFQSDGTVVGTVLKPYQFSGWNTKDVNRIRCATCDTDDPEVRSCAQAWSDSNGPDRILPLDTVHYLNPVAVEKMPEWALEDHRVAVIGDHHFYRSA